MLRSLPATLTVCIGASVLSAPALAQGTPCQSSAGDMFRSCGFEVQQELRVTLANCRQFEEDSERTACNRAARRDRREAAGVCRDQRAAREDACALLGEVRYADPLLDAGIGFVDPDLVGDGAAINPFLSLEAGHTFVLRAGADLVGGAVDELVVVHVTDQVREIEEVSCRVVVDAVVGLGEDEEDGTIDYAEIEVTDDWFAQDEDGNVYYCGEIARNFEDGVLRDLDGSFEAGFEFARAGLQLAADPGNAPQVHRQEYSLGEAEDIIQYVDAAATPSAEEGGENAAFPCAGGCLKTFDFAPLGPEATEFKYYLPGTGFVLAVSMEDGELTGEREELVCVGDSLEVLASAACAAAIEDPQELLDDLCELHPAAFCTDDEND
jgi:hypothetical protein